METKTSGAPWTREAVETRLIAAFRAMPGLAVYSHRRSVRTMTGGDAGALLGALGWTKHLDADPDGRKYLWAWARCQATRDSFAALCIGMRWSQSTAERGRRRAAQTIAQSLSLDPSA